MKKRFGLLGRKLGHSYSPPIHEALTNGAYDYRLIELEPDELGIFLNSGEFDGLNVTIPYKRDVIPFLDELTPIAKKIGAVNTIFRRGGRLIGDNTDAYGVRFALERLGLTVAGTEALILGSGGTSRTVAAVLRENGAASVTVVSRQGPVTYPDALTQIGCNLIINTTPLGMSPATEGDPLPLDGFPRLRGVFDAIYNPLRTRFIQRAERLGLPAANGLWMLIAQAKAAAERFLDAELNEREIERVDRMMIERTENIVLIGMPGAGKTTVGRALAAQTGKTFVDLDEVFVRRVGASIPEYFKTHGESAFRDAESDLAAEFGKKTGQVLATGGGAVLRGENQIHLRMNGAVIFLERAIDALPIDGRPISQSAASLSDLYQKRLPRYLETGDYRVMNDRDVGSVVERIIEWLNQRQAQA